MVIVEYWDRYDFKCLDRKNMRISKLKGVVAPYLVDVSGVRLINKWTTPRFHIRAGTLVIVINCTFKQVNKICSDLDLEQYGIEDVFVR